MFGAGLVGRLSRSLLFRSDPFHGGKDSGGRSAVRDLLVSRNKTSLSPQGVPAPVPRVVHLDVAATVAYLPFVPRLDGTSP